MTINDPRYPIGKFTYQGMQDAAKRARCIEAIAQTPARLRAAVTGLSEEQMDTPYREGGWTLRQVVHHVPDSHLNAYVRFKLALTEHQPTVKTYDERKWAELADTRMTPPEVSLALLESLHRRWVKVLETMSSEEFARQLNHPEHGLMTLDHLLALYAWHGPHHIAHITSLRERRGWN